MSTFKEKLRKAKEGLYNYSDTEVKVRDATSSDPWGPHTPQLQELAKCTFDSQQYSELFPMLWKRLMDVGSIQHVSKALTCSLHLARHGAMRFIQDLKSRKREIKTLETYRHFDSDGHDDGVPVRQKAKVLMSMITDKEMLMSERKKAKDMDERRAKVNFSGGVGSKGNGAKTKESKDKNEQNVFDDDEPPTRSRGLSNPFGDVAEETPSNKNKKDKKKKKKDKKKKNKQRDNDSGDDAPDPFAAPTTTDPFATANADPFATSTAVDPFAAPSQPQQAFAPQPQQTINQNTTEIASLFAPVEPTPPPPPATAPADDIISLFGNASISNNSQQVQQQSGNPFGGNNASTGQGNPFGQQKSTTDIFGAAQNRQMPGMGMQQRQYQQQRMMQQNRMGMGMQRNNMMGMQQQGMMGMQQQGMMGMQQQGMRGMQQQQQGNPFGNMGMGMQQQQQPRQANNPNDPFAFSAQPQQMAYNNAPQRNSGQNKSGLNDAFAGLANF